MRNSIGVLRRYARFAVKLRAALRRPLTLQTARAIIERRMAERDTNFLASIDLGVFRNPRSPYRPLLRRAGAEFGDISTMVKRQGVDATLEELRRAGVYVNLEEFKGRTPIRRNELEVAVSARDFDNPLVDADYTATSGGTTGPVTRVGVNLESLVAQAPPWVVAYDALGVLGAPMALWRGALPDASGMNILLREGALFGQTPEKWFAPFLSRRRPLVSRLITEYIIAVGRSAGVRIPRPEVVELNNAGIVARWAASAAASHGACVLRANASMSLRTAIAAREAGISLNGVTMIGGGEPPTPSKVNQIRSSGARWMPTYAFTEAGCVGGGCAVAAAGDDVHVFSDLFALIQAPHPVPDSELTVPAFYFTSLTPTAPKVLLNAQVGDYGVLETRSCGCSLGELGLWQHVREIRSFGLLNTEGMTILVEDMSRLIDEVLPARFGGSPLDYQIAEEEDERGFTRLTLIVSPRVTLSDEQAVIDAVTNSVLGSSRAIWPQARSLRIRRGEPSATGRGKSIPLQLGQRGRHAHKETKTQ